MSAAALPESIKISDIERDYVHSNLDFAYIDEAAQDAAAILSARGVAELAYQPGDRTRYNLVLVPLTLLEYARPRIVDGEVWDRHAFEGMGDASAGTFGGEAYYGQDGYLLVINDSAYPVRLGGDGHWYSPTYLSEKWSIPSPTSAVSLMLIIHAIDHYLRAA